MRSEMSISMDGYVGQSEKGSQPCLIIFYVDGIIGTDWYSEYLFVELDESVGGFAKKRGCNIVANKRKSWDRTNSSVTKLLIAWFNRRMQEKTTLNFRRTLPPADRIQRVSR